MGMAQIILTPLPGESLYSLLGRLGAINGYNAKETTRYFLDDVSDSRVADSPFKFAAFARNSRNLYRRELILSLTNRVYKKNKYLSSSKAFETSGVNKRNLTLIDLSHCEAHIWKWCDECRISDIQQYGFTYWRLNLQHAGALICDIHSHGLCEAILPYRDRQKVFIFPEDFSLGHYEFITYLIDKRSFALALKVSEISRNLVYGSAIQSMYALQMTLLKQIRTQHNYPPAVNTSKLFQSFEEMYKSLCSIARIAFFLNPRVFTKSLKKSLCSCTIVDLNSIFLPLIISWLFDDWNQFTKAFEWESVLCLDNQPNRPINLGPKAQTHRAICIQYLQENPKALKLDFWKCHPKSCKWLNANDPVWFNVQLPNSQFYKNGQKELFIS